MASSLALRAGANALSISQSASTSRSTSRETVAPVRAALHTSQFFAGSVASSLGLSSFTRNKVLADCSTKRMGLVGISPAPFTVTCTVKKWEKKKLTKNGVPITHKMHVHIGDTVQVIAGSDKGKVSEVMRISRHNSMVILKDVNVKTKHQKPRAEGETGQIITFEAPIHSSNVALYSKTANSKSRVGHKVLDDGRKVRYLIKTGEVVDQPYQKPAPAEDA